MARRRSSVRMQARPGPSTSPVAVMGLILGAFLAVIVLLLVIKRKQKAKAYRDKVRNEQFMEDAVDLTGQLAAFAAEHLSAMEKPQPLPDEAWTSFRASREDGVIDAMIMVRAEMQTKYLDGAFSRGQAPELKKSESTKDLPNDVSMSKGEVTMGGQTWRVRVFQKPVMKGEDFLGTVILLMEPPGR